jgi:hypothetical protein
MHLLNLGLNVVRTPIRFVFVNSEFLSEQKEQYAVPSHCRVNNSTVWQECEDDSGNFSTANLGYTYAEWLLTMKPHVFGLVPGSAFPTGVLLILVVTVMFACSMPAVRRSGHFEVFYFSHLLYMVYYTALLLHAPACYKWVTVPIVIFLLELFYRGLSMFSRTGRGRSLVQAGIVLPSRVTGLVIKKTDRFNFCPGDWVFIKIPAVANFEWHPFTISSAPEQKDYFTLHIRGVGGWTNKLYDLIAEEYKQQEEEAVPRKLSRLETIKG